MALDQRFMAAVVEAVTSDESGSGALPPALARACVQVLPVAGAAVSFCDELRIPLGASDAMAVRAERLETTLGDGPCLSAVVGNVPLRATGLSLATRWPVFHQELCRLTPYRSVVCIPLHSEHRERFGALDLYVLDEHALSEVDLDLISSEVADAISGILFDRPGDAFGGIKICRRGWPPAR